MYPSDNQFNARDYPEKRKRLPSLLAVLIMAAIGAFLGCLLYAAIFDEVREPPEKQQVPERIWHDYQHTEVVGAVEKAAPAVVGISNSVSVTRPGARMLIEQASGSGVVIDGEGHIVTNQHVINGAEKIEVVFCDGRTIEARLVGEDVLTDLAVVKINPGRDGVKYAVLSDSDNVHIGETAIAIGNPLGLVFQQTVTAGVVSAVGRQVPVPQSHYRYTYIQTDAAINEGNSGGALINLAGDIIGINSAKIKDTGVEGMGFAIPSNTVARVVEDIIKHGKVRRPYIGVYIQDLAEATGNSGDRGVYIQEVSGGGAAEKAGVLAGDVIVAVDGRQINVTAQLFDQLLNYEPGEELTIKIRRNGGEKNLTIELMETPEQY